MTYRFLFIIFILSFFLQGYQYNYKVPVIDATNNAASRNNEGIMYMEMGEYVPAITDFKIAISLSPNSPASAAYYNNLGLAYMKIGAFSAAQPCFEKAIELNPVFLEYYQNLISLYSKNNHLNSALNSYQKQIKSNNKNSQAYFMLGLIYKQKGNKVQSTKYLKKYITLEKENVLSRAAKQMIYEMNCQ